MGLAIPGLSRESYLHHAGIGEVVIWLDFRNRGAKTSSVFHAFDLKHISRFAIQNTEFLRMSKKPTPPLPTEANVVRDDTFEDDIHLGDFTGDAWHRPEDVDGFMRNLTAEGFARLRESANAAAVYRMPYPSEPITSSNDPYEEAHREKVVSAIISYRQYRRVHGDPSNPSPEERAKAKTRFPRQPERVVPANSESDLEPEQLRERDQLEATRIIICSLLGLSDKEFYDHDVPEPVASLPPGMMPSLNAHGFAQVARNINYDAQLAAHDILAILMHYCSSLPDLTIEAAKAVANEIDRQRRLDRPSVEYVDGKPRYLPPARKRLT